MKTLFFLFVLLLGAVHQKPKPTVWLIGDSTVKNGSGKGEDGLWGWGDFLNESFDTSKIHIENRARGGRSSRTYQTEGLWDNVLSQMKPGDYVIMQFGHNDAGAVNDTLRARGSIKGIGEETEQIDNLITKKHEIVHTYGWYMRKYIRDVKSKNAIAIVCSPVARNDWKDGKVVRSAGYAQWASEVANQENAFYIDLNDLVASQYESLGEAEVSSKLFLKDHTHTTREGARLNATLVSKAIAGQKELPLRKFLKR